MGKRKAVHSEKEVPKVNKELSCFDIKINSFGEIITSYDLDIINDFLDRNVEDKKLKNRDEFLAKKHPHEEDEEEEMDEDDNDEVLNREEKENLIDWEEDKEEKDED